MQRFRYRGFISYSKRDHKFAKKLHRWLESYWVPKSLDGSSERQRLGRFFRDDDELSASHSIGAALRGAIEDSESLIVICSPHAAGSEWVNEEIEHFRRYRNSEKIFAIIISGEPNSDDLESECFPPAFRRSTKNNISIRDDIEPFALSLKGKNARANRARLVAGLLSVPFDTLWKRDQRKRRRTIVTGALLTTMTASIATTVFLSLRMSQLETEREAELINSVSKIERFLSEGNTRMALSTAIVTYYEKLNDENSQHQKYNVRNDFRSLLETAIARNKVLSTYSLSRPDRIEDLVFWSNGVGFTTAAEFGSIAQWSLGKNSPDIEFNPSPSSRLLRAKLPVILPGGEIVVYHGIGDHSELASWEVRSKEKQTLSVESNTRALEILGDGKRLLSANTSGSIQEISSETGEVLFEYDKHIGTWALAVSPVGDRFLSLTSKSVTLWEIGRRAPIWRVVDIKGGPDTVLWHPSANQFLIDNNDSDTAVLWSVEERKPIREFSGHKELITSAAFSVAGKRLVTASHDQTVILWDVDTGEEIERYVAPRATSRGVWFSRNDASIFASYSSGEIVEWAMPNSQSQLLPSPSFFLPGLSALQAADINSSNRTLIKAGVGTPEVQLIDAQSGKLISSHRNTGLKGIWDAKFLPLGDRYLVAGEGFEDESVTALLFETNKSSPVQAFINSGKFGIRKVHVLQRHQSFVAGGHRVVQYNFSSDGAISNPELVYSNPGFDFMSMAVNPEESKLAVGLETGKIQFWNIGEPDPLEMVIDNSSSVRSLSFSDDGRSLLAGSSDGIVREWSMNGGELLMAYDADRDEVLASSYHPNNKHIIAALRSGEVVLWRRGSNKLIDRRRGNEDFIFDLLFVGDAEKSKVNLLSASEDGDIYVHKLPDHIDYTLEQQIRLSCHLLIADGEFRMPISKMELYPDIDFGKVVNFCEPKYEDHPLK